MQSDGLPNPYAPPATASLPQRGALGGAYASQRQSVLVLIVLSVITIGIYPAVWFLLRQSFLDSLDSGPKLGALAFGPLAANLLSIGLAFAGLPESASRVVGYGLGAVSIVTAFRVAAILRSNFARTGRPLKVSRLLTFVFNIFYLQHVINRAAVTRALAPEAQ